MLHLISPEFFALPLSKTVPPHVDRYKVPGSEPAFGSSPKADYLIQKLHQGTYQAWFIDILSADAHKINILEDDIPSFFIIVQIANTLDWQLYDLPQIQNQEWSINLYCAPKIYAEVLSQPASESTTYILHLHDTEIQKFAKQFSVIEVFHDQACTHTKKLFKHNRVCTFGIMDRIKSIRKGNKGVGAYQELAAECFKSFADINLIKQRPIESEDLQQCYTLNKFLLNNLTVHYTRDALRDMFDLPAHYVDTFTKIYGVSPFELHRYYKMSAARFALQESNITLKELAAIYGYSYNGFIKAYEAVYHEHPTAHRRIQV